MAMTKMRYSARRPTRVPIKAFCSEGRRNEMSERSAAEAALYQLTKDTVRVSDDDLDRVVAGEPLSNSRGPRGDVSFPADGAEDVL